MGCTRFSDDQFGEWLDTESRSCTRRHAVRPPSRSPLADIQMSQIDASTFIDTSTETYTHTCTQTAEGTEQKTLLHTSGTPAARRKCHHDFETPFSQTQYLETLDSETITFRDARPNWQWLPKLLQASRAVDSFPSRCRLPPPLQTSPADVGVPSCCWLLQPLPASCAVLVCVCTPVSAKAVLHLSLATCANCPANVLPKRAGTRAPPDCQVGHVLHSSQSITVGWPGALPMGLLVRTGFGAILSRDC